MKFEQGRRGLRSALVLCLAGLFFLLAMGVALLGSNLYRAVAADADENYVHRTALSYVANQIRRADAGTLSTGIFMDGAGVETDVLYFMEVEDDGSLYETLIYCYDGYLRELYMEKGTGLGPEAGTPILELDSLTLDASIVGLLTVTAEKDGASWSVSLSPRTNY